MKLNEKILYCRKKAGMSQLDLADALGVSRQAVSKWETGEAHPDVLKIPQMAALFHVTADWLLSDAQPEEPERQPEEPEQQPSDTPDRKEAPPQTQTYPGWVNNLPKHMLRMVKQYGWIYGVRIAVSGGIMTAIGILARWIFKTMILGSAMNSVGSIGSMGGMTWSMAGGGDIPPEIMQQLMGQTGDVFTTGMTGFSNTAWSIASVFTGFAIALGVGVLLAGIVLAVALKKWGEKPEG